MFVPTISRFPFIHLDGEKHYGSEVSLKNTTQWTQKGFKIERVAYTLQ